MVVVLEEIVTLMVILEDLVVEVVMHLVVEALVQVDLQHNHL
jgi:hypothetical protein